MPQWLRKLLGLIVDLDRINDLVVTIRDNQARASALGTMFKLATALALLGCLFPYFIGIQTVAGAGLVGDALQFTAVIGMSLGLFALAEHHSAKEWQSVERRKQIERRATIAIWIAFAALYGPKLLADPKPEPADQSFFASEPFL